MSHDQINIFDIRLDEDIKKDGPLAVRMRPERIEDFVGQGDIISPGKLLYRLIKSDKLSSMILWGPPGTGKTTLARIIANSTKAYFQQVNAVTSGIPHLRKIIQSSKDRRVLDNQRTMVFIDEIHRFNKAQQDVLLPYVEDGTIVLIGATTENPQYEVNSALLSRSTLFRLNPLKDTDIKEIIKRCLEDKKNGLGLYNAAITEDAMSHIIMLSNGDARQALNALELAVLTTEKGDEGKVVIDLKTAQECIQKRIAQYDKSGDGHYDTISAFIKSIRGSNPDAALHYLSRMIYAGEDPMFIARRIIISASEDIGNADPSALTVAVAAANALKIIGMPEGSIILAQAVTYLACAPKSNASYLGIKKALNDVEKTNVGFIPHNLKNTSNEYKNPHDYDDNHVNQQYMPDLIKNKKYYNPTNNGYEKVISDFLNTLG